jgi:hypothetical protein
MSTALFDSPQPHLAKPAVARLLTARPAPRREPPFDDEIDIHRPALTRFDRPLPFERPQIRPEPVVIRRRIDDELPDPAVWGRRLLIGLVEAAAGKRPMQQLDEFLTPAIAQGLRAELQRSETSGRRHWLHRATPGSVRAMQPCRGIAEVSATVYVGPRVRALALRVERRHDRWRCTRIQLG